MTTSFQTEQVNEALRAFETSRIPPINNLNTPLIVDPTRARIVGDQAGYQPHMKAYEYARLWIKENGSAREGYKSMSTAQTLEAAMAVGALLGEDYLIVSDVTRDGELVHPAKLSLQDLVGYETLKQYK